MLPLNNTLLTLKSVQCMWPNRHLVKCDLLIALCDHPLAGEDKGKSTIVGGDWDFLNSHPQSLTVVLFLRFSSSR